MEKEEKVVVRSRLRRTQQTALIKVSSLLVPLIFFINARHIQWVYRQQNANLQYISNVIDSSVSYEGRSGNVRRGNNPDGVPVMSVAILTYKNSLLVGKLLESVLEQKTEFTYEILVTDNGCRPETKATLNRILNDATVQHKYLPLCTNPGYAIGNNEGVEKLAHPQSKWILFLNDDVQLQPKFLQYMYDMAELKAPQAVGVGCKVLSEDSSKLIEAGSLVWNQGGTGGYARDRTDIDASDLMYARPVDYVSGVCFMMEHQAFVSYGGFDHKNFPNYYEDTDLQMHIQHDLDAEVWYQPLAIANHHEHGSFGQSDAVRLMEKGAEVFRNKWKDHLPEHVFPNLDQWERSLLLASDIRSRLPNKVNLLYLDERIPNIKTRSHSNIMALNNLHHRVALSTIKDEAQDDCTFVCKTNITQSGVEVVTPREMSLRSFLLENRQDFYQVVVASQRYTMDNMQDILRMGRQSPQGFSIIFDCGPDECGLKYPPVWLDLVDVIIVPNEKERQAVFAMMNKQTQDVLLIESPPTKPPSLLQRLVGSTASSGGLNVTKLEEDWSKAVSMAVSRRAGRVA